MIKVIHVPLEDHALSASEYKFFADCFRKSYEKFMGVSTEHITYNFYTLEEQIERYAKNLTFWNLQLDKMNSSRCKLKNNRIKFIKTQIDKLSHTIENIFPPYVIPLVLQKAADTKTVFKIRRKEIFTPPKIRNEMEQKIIK